MRTQPIRLVSSAVAALVLLVSLGASAALAKEGVSVNLAAPLPGDAEPGSIVPAVFTMTAISDDVASPLEAASVFIRLYGPGGDMTEAAGVEQATPGLYKAMIAIPKGGVARCEFGIHGSVTAGGKVVATDPVWAYDGVIVTARKPAPAAAKAPQPAAVVPAAASVAPARAEPAPVAPVGVSTAAAVLGLGAALGALGLIAVSRRNRLRRTAA